MAAALIFVAPTVTANTVEVNPPYAIYGNRPESLAINLRAGRTGVASISERDTLKANSPGRLSLANSEAKRKAELKKEFDRLVKQWASETSFHSSLGEVFTNDAYQRIMAMGRDALPWILAELKRKPGHWFYALEKIVGTDIPEGATTFGEARAAWLDWGRNSNYI